jgi:DNA/RNA endonuclease YhcR with UshA esterase domain
MKTRADIAAPPAIMRFSSVRFSPQIFLGLILLLVLVSISGICSAGNPPKQGCVAFAEASKHLGTTACVSGTVLHVEEGRNGTAFLNFCEDKLKDKTCPFTVVVFPSDLKKMGDVRQLEGRQIEIKGTIQDYDGRAEIILRRSHQLGAGAFLLFPEVPTDYDVERPGHYSAGKFSRPKAAKKTQAKQGDPVSIEDPGEPQ